VTVFIRETGKSYITSDNGSFNIGRLKPGKYTLEVSLVGYETLIESVTVEEGKTTTVQLQLKISNAQLEEIVVKSARNKFAPVASLHAAKMPLAVLENPQSIS
ncbi:carboxypeptidase-like regulatory domain-containing protein, partial [Flavihumibacter sediminis]|nr:carboxypeptidase-like regulatory domain-containing protein [Flavihumibacter sediminis]